MNNGETVFIVDSDTESRKRVCRVVESMQLRHESFTLAQDFLDRYDPERPGCAILEVRISDVSGLQLQQQLARHAPPVPVIFLTAHASVPVVVRAIQQGAVNFLEKPADEQLLWETIQQALKLDRHQRTALAEAESIHQRLRQLTRKEHDVLELIGQMKSIRTIARELDVSVRTVEFRRSRILEKLEIASPLQLLCFAIQTLGNGDGVDGRERTYHRGSDAGMPQMMTLGRALHS